MWMNFFSLNKTQNTHTNPYTLIAFNTPGQVTKRICIEFEMKHNKLKLVLYRFKVIKPKLANNGYQIKQRNRCESDNSKFADIGVFIYYLWLVIDSIPNKKSQIFECSSHSEFNKQTLSGETFPFPFVCDFGRWLLKPPCLFLCLISLHAQVID